MVSPSSARPMASIWLWAFLYFFFYVPYSGMTKALSGGLTPGLPQGVDGVTLLPISTLAGIVVMLLFVFGSGWWRYATQLRLGPLSLPVPTWPTFVSGLCTAVILATTTLAYTFDGVSIVFMMLLMRGGVLVLAPIIDRLSGRHTRWYSWIGLVLSMAALVVAFAEKGGTALSLLAALDVALYLAGYSIRLRLMSHQAKSDDAAATKRYFIEEQLVVAPMTVVFLGLVALWGQGGFALAVREGFVGWWSSGFAVHTAAIGVFSQLVGIFGTLIYLDARENTFSVPVNRCSSILSGVVASFALTAAFGLAPPSVGQLVGAGLVVGAILVMGLAPRWTGRGAAGA
ncbi:MAG: hypothetical protein H6742_08565 [Alphaproteobacteria bacterium]|nr:hypothetical protein [Alphaproteobacteria bacterium]